MTVGDVAETDIVLRRVGESRLSILIADPSEEDEDMAEVGLVRG